VSETRDKATPSAKTARADRKPSDLPGNKRPAHKAAPGIGDLPSEPASTVKTNLPVDGPAWSSIQMSPGLVPQ
jgi:hypothetical protein